MQTINVRNVNEALPEGIRLLEAHGVERDSRNGPVVVAPGPVTTVYNNPKERVIFWAERDANPFFHFVESLWMMAGRNDVAFVANYVKRMATFSDDGETLHGAYGHRWIKHFGDDQLPDIAVALKSNPDDRRCVLQMWDAVSDLGYSGKDVPCNTQAYFSRDINGALDMTVCCRSNDMIWGAYGANAVHFSFLQECMAGFIGCEVGKYWQMSNNYHAYKDTLEPLKHLADETMLPASMKPTVGDPYQTELVKPYPIVNTDMVTWRQDLDMFLNEGVVLGLRDHFFRRVAQPIMQAHEAYKANIGRYKYEIPLEIMEQCKASDWQHAINQWLMRRYSKFNKAASDGVTY